MTNLQRLLTSALGDTFEIERELGRGGMSRVFLATEIRLGRRVVIKVLLPELAEGLSSRRFEREIALSAACQHPHLVPLLQSGEVGGLPWFSMPFVSGESLRNRLERDGPLPIALVRRILSETADALAYAHDRGVVHRDIKPENILLSADHALVADFGVAKALDLAHVLLLDVRHPGMRAGFTATAAGQVFGTMAYMAPEQAVGDPDADHRVDLYALGLVGYEMLTGKLPFAGPSPQATLAARLTQSPEPVTAHRADCPPDLSALLQRLLEKDPDRRPASGHEVVQALQSLGAPAEGSPARRRPRQFVTAGLLAVAVAAMAYVGLTRFRNGGAPPAAPIQALAVLAFTSPLTDTTDRYFSEGMTEELTNALGRIPGLKVASGASAGGLEGLSLRDLGARLGVDAVLRGSVRRSGGRLRMNLRLEGVQDGFVVWSENYERPVDDVFQLQEDIARSVAEALEVRLSSSTGAALVPRPTRDLQAYEAYLRGRYLWSERSPESLRRAVAAFDQALTRDSLYALAWAGLADTYSMMAPYGDLPPGEALTRATTAARRAVDLDPDLAEAHTSVGIIEVLYGWDMAEASRHLRRAVALNPNYAPAHQFLAWQLLYSGDGEAALEAMRTARRLDPLSPIIGTRVASFLHMNGRPAEALEALGPVLELEPDHQPALAQRALSLAALGRLEEAKVALPPPGALLGDVDGGARGMILARSGDTAGARAELARMQAEGKTRYVEPQAQALIHTALGDLDRAFAALEVALEARAQSLPLVTVYPEFAPLRRDSRYRRLVERMGLRPTDGR